MTDGETAGGRRLKSVDRTFNIIEFLQEHGPMTLSEIADDFGLPMSTAHIHLSTLVGNGYVVKADGKYRCSFRFLRTGGELRDRLPLFQAAKNEIDDLQEILGEHANVVTIEDGYMIQLYKSENPESIDDSAPLGSHLYLHTTANGKAMLSRLQEAELNEVLELRGLPQLTAATITDRDELREELSDVRERGYAINRGEHFAGVCAVGVPITSKDQGVLGAISVSGPTRRMGAERIEDDIAPALFDAKNIIDLKIKQGQDGVA
jgi:DNA-binding IclR family transcriptional regulator